MKTLIKFGEAPDVVVEVTYSSLPMVGYVAIHSEYGDSVEFVCPFDEDIPVLKTTIVKLGEWNSRPLELLGYLLNTGRRMISSAGALHGGTEESEREAVLADSIMDAVFGNVGE